jgi:sugar phosphate isomerase/epimerase
MLKCGDWPIGICSWSLQTDLPGLAKAMEQLQTNHVHLDLRPACTENSQLYLEQVIEKNWTITSTMIGFPQEDYSTLEAIKLTGGIVPDRCWDNNKKIFLSAVDATVKLNAPFLSTHIGFIDHTQPDYARKVYDRVKFMADASAENNITLLLETGQETAEDLKNFLEELKHPLVGVNFDPANMILYDKGNPIGAVGVLSPWIKHVHIKDAIRTNTPGTWGIEVPWGQGQVGQQQFLTSLSKIGFAGALAIEREAGNNRFDDIKKVIEKLQMFEK